jgi:hypothetical protein
MGRASDLREAMEDYRAAEGNAAYRGKVRQLSENARHLVYGLEAGLSELDVIDRLAAQIRNGRGTGGGVTQDDLREAKVELEHLVHEVYDVFGLGVPLAGVPDG